MISLKTLIGLAVISACLFVMIPFVDWNALPGFLAYLFLASVVVCYFAMMGVQGALSLRHGISLGILFLYLVHPYVSIGVFCYHYVQGRARGSKPRP